MSKPKNNTPRIQSQQPNNQLFGLLMLATLVVGSMYLAFNSKGAGNSAPQAVAGNPADETAGWYLYQTKHNKFFEVRYPHHWTFVYGGGFEGKELLQVKNAGPKIDFKVLARSNRRHPNLESFLKEIDATNQTQPSFHVLREEKIIVDGRPAIQREEYLIARQVYSIVTYIFGQDVMAEFSTESPNARLINPSARALHQSLLSTFRFLR